MMLIIGVRLNTNAEWVIKTMKLETILIKSNLLTKDDLKSIKETVPPENQTRFLLDVLYDSLSYDERKVLREYGYRLESFLKGDK